MAIDLMKSNLNETTPVSSHRSEIIYTSERINASRSAFGINEGSKGQALMEF